MKEGSDVWRHIARKQACWVSRCGKWRDHGSATFRRFLCICFFRRPLSSWAAVFVFEDVAAANRPAPSAI